MKNHLLLSLSIVAISALPVLANPDKTAPATPTASATPAAPAPAAAAQPEEKVSLSGKILQTMDAGGYSYIYLETKDGKKKWVAISATPVKVGSNVTFKPGTEMINFESKALKRVFEAITFSDGIVYGAIPEKAANQIKEQGKSVGSSGAVAPKTGKISVPKATGEGAINVDEAFKNSTKWNNKQIVINGKVAKVTTGILGKNWIHIQDGTGSFAKKTHNLVCTSDQMADVGDMVTVKGKLIKDKNFGSGYRYAVIIEEAQITKLEK